mgnify:CR=1 FL=1
MYFLIYNLPDDLLKVVFNYLDKMPDPIIIVETGCLRITNNFLDGQGFDIFYKPSRSGSPGTSQNFVW